tara:strand:+ start:32 stop:1090 length:1059 start_codon:yes stop_codon:yes gene_type:complete
MSKKVNKYKKAGVNINEGNKFVKLIKKKIFSTHNKGAIKDLGSFAGFFDISILKYKNPILLSATDGVGTKIKIAQDLNKYKWIGEDLVAMCLNDILVHGGKPIFFLDYIAVAKLKKKMAVEIIDGIVKGCKGSRCSILGGETAEMPGLYKNDDFDLAGFAVGIVEKKNLITGSNIKEGDEVFGLKSTGFHSNGFSLIRYILKKKKISYKKKISKEIVNLGEFLLKPTKIYTKIISELTKDNLVNGICHITGGGIIDNLPRILPKKLGLNFENHNWKLPYIYKWFKNQGDISFDEMLKVFNCGIGMIITCSPKNKKIVLRKLKNKNEPFFNLGKIVRNNGKIELNYLKKDWEC